MRLHRFYIDKPLGEEIVVEIGSENKEEQNLAHQWTHVFRYTSGDEVFLFSSLSPGKDFLYRISDISKQKISLIFVSLTPNILPRPCTLVMALVKKDTFESVARQATELGVTRIIPFRASRSEKKNLNFERLVAIVTEASEQCGRGSVPEITPISSLEEAIAFTSLSVRLFGSLHGNPIAESLKQLENKGRELSLWVGPEGGWTGEEESFASANGFVPLKLTDTVLKADTAATALLSVVQSAFPSRE